MTSEVFILHLSSHTILFFSLSLFLPFAHLFLSAGYQKHIRQLALTDTYPEFDPSPMRAVSNRGLTNA